MSATLTRHARPDRGNMSAGVARRRCRTIPAEPRAGPGRRPPPPRPLDAAGRALVEAHLPLAYGEAWVYARGRGRWLPADELIAEALYALTYAASRYDPAAGSPFRAYARVVVRHRLGIFARTWHARGRDLPLSSLDADADGEPWAHSSLPDVAPGPAEAAARREACERVRAALPPAWYAVLWGHLGERQTLQELADRLGLSRQRAGQIERAALGFVRGLRGGLEV